MYYIAGVDAHILDNVLKLSATLVILVSLGQSM